MLAAEEAGELLRSIESDTVTGLRDRALIGVMVFTFARVSAACGLNVTDIFHQQRRLVSGCGCMKRAASSTKCPATTRSKATSPNTSSVQGCRRE